MSWHENRNRESAAELASALDEAAALAKDNMIIRGLIRMKNLALDSRTDNPAAKRIDRENLERINRLKGLIRDGAEVWNLMQKMNEIETALYDRERRRDSESQLVVDKRRLFVQLRALSCQIDWLEARRAKILRDSMSLSKETDAMRIELNGDEYNQLTLWLRQTIANYNMTRQSLQNMNTVQLLHSEEKSLALLDRSSAGMPSVEEIERMVDNIDVTMEMNRKKAEAIEALRREFESIAGANSPETADA